MTTMQASLHKHRKQRKANETQQNSFTLIQLFKNSFIAKYTA